jgi:hypothetical protein
MASSFDPEAANRDERIDYVLEKIWEYTDVYDTLLWAAFRKDFRKWKARHFKDMCYIKPVDRAEHGSQLHVSLILFYA